MADADPQGGASSGCPQVRAGALVTVGVPAEDLLMGFDIDFLGHFDIAPALNEAEVEHIRALGTYDHYWRPDRTFPPRRVVRTAEQPSPACQWEVCNRGCCLRWDGNEKFYEAVEWLEYLVDHLLRPKAKASRSRSRDPQFEGFTFDHVVDGVVVGCRTDDGELFSINARRNRISTTVLHAGKTAWDVYPELSAAPQD